MKRLILLLILLAMPAYAEDVQIARLSPAMVGGSAPAAPAFSWEIAEDFSASDGTDVTIAAGCVHDWTERVGNWTIATNALVDPGTSYNIITCNTTLANSARQYGKMNVSFASEYWGGGFYFRGDTSGDAYMIRFNASDNDVTWSTLDDWNQTGGAIETDVWSVTYTSGWIGFEVSGTGDSTVVQYWYWADDPLDWDAAHTTWGAPTATMETNPTVARDSGTTVGVRGGAILNWNVLSFYAGSSGS